MLIWYKKAIMCPELNAGFGENFQVFANPQL